MFLAKGNICLWNYKFILCIQLFRFDKSVCFVSVFPVFYSAYLALTVILLHTACWISNIINAQGMVVFIISPFYLFEEFKKKTSVSWTKWTNAYNTSKSIKLSSLFREMNRNTAGSGTLSIIIRVLERVKKKNHLHHIPIL